jgi:hypothetical protein
MVLSMFTSGAIPPATEQSANVGIKLLRVTVHPGRTRMQAGLYPFASKRRPSQRAFAAGF